MRIIKKYKNRRLYDTELSQYITFEDVKKYVLDDVAFKVLDSSTQSDITSATLLQVIVEQESGMNHCFSDQALRHMIKMSAHPMHQAYSVLFEQTMASINEQMQSNPVVENYQKSLEQWQKGMQSAMKSWQDLFK